MSQNGEASIIQEITHSWSETFFWDVLEMKNNETRTKTFRKTVFEDRWNHHQLIADLRLSVKASEVFGQGFRHLSGSISISSVKNRPTSKKISWYLNLGHRSSTSSTPSERNILVEKAWKNEPTNWEEDENNFDKYVTSKSFNVGGIDVQKDGNTFQFHVKIKGPFECPNYSNEEIPTVGPSMSEAMKNMFLTGKMSDITIKCEDQEFTCHKIILCARSDVFETMFNASSFRESQEGVLEIKDIDKQTMKIFLNYIYTDRIEGHDTELLNVIYVAHKYNVPRLVNKCAKELIKKTNRGNAMEVLRAGYLVENTHLFQKTMDYLKKNELLAKMKGEWKALKEAYPALGNKVAEYFMFQSK